MNAFKCDRCDRFFESKPDKRLEIWKLIDTMIDEDKLLDICPACQAALVTFMQPPLWQKTILPNLPPEDVQKVKEAGLLPEALHNPIECPNCLHFTTNAGQHIGTEKPNDHTILTKWNCTKRWRIYDINGNDHLYDDEPSEALKSFLHGTGWNPDCIMCNGDGVYMDKLCTCKLEAQVPF